MPPASPSLALRIRRPPLLVCCACCSLALRAMTFGAGAWSGRAMFFWPRSRARNFEECERRFFDAWLPHAAGSADCPRRHRFSTRRAAAFWRRLARTRRRRDAPGAIRLKPCLSQSSIISRAISIRPLKLSSARRESRCQREIVRHVRPGTDIERRPDCFAGRRRLWRLLRGLEDTPGMIDALARRCLERGRPFFGICVGMQLLADRGLEHGVHQGLGWIGGEVEPYPARG